MVKGGFGVKFDGNKESRLGVLPRYATDESEIRWFTIPTCYIFHTCKFTLCLHPLECRLCDSLVSILVSLMVMCSECVGGGGWGCSHLLPNGRHQSREYGNSISSSAYIVRIDHSSPCILSYPVPARWPLTPNGLGSPLRPISYSNVLFFQWVWGKNGIGIWPCCHGSNELLDRSKELLANSRHRKKFVHELWRAKLLINTSGIVHVKSIMYNILTV